MNLCFIAVPKEMYAYYTDETYPTSPDYPGDAPNFSACQNDNERAAVTIQHQQDMITWSDIQTMNVALSDIFLELIDPQFRSIINDARIKKPNMLWCDVFATFRELYGKADEVGRAENLKRLNTAWSPADGFEMLIKRINECIFYAIFAGDPLSQQQIVDAVILNIKGNGLYTEELKEWKRQISAKTVKNTYREGILFGSALHWCKLMVRYHRVAYQLYVMLFPFG